MYAIGSIEYREGKPVIHRESTEQGEVYKNEQNYYFHSEEPCYVPEMSDDIYTGNDFMELAEGNQDIADLLFDMVDWQSPETLMCDLMSTNEIIRCENCGKLVLYGDGMSNIICPHCHSKIEEE